jgi:hypothetical protein
MIFAEIQEADGEKLLVIRVVAPKDPHQETPDEVPKFNIFIDESWNTRDYITPALTDITNRTFTGDQITLMSPCENTPAHLTVEKTKKIEAAHAATSTSETLVLLTAEPDERDDYLTVLNTKTGKEFKVIGSVDLIDAICDFVKPLKTKTFANVTVELTCKNRIKLHQAQGTISTYLSLDNRISLSIPDGVGDQNLRFQISSETRAEVLKITYSYDDLIIGKRISGGVILTF